MIAALAGATGLDFAALMDMANGSTTERAVRLNLENAVDGGVFGSPAYVLAGEVFWGPGSARPARRCTQERAGALYSRGLTDRLRVSGSFRGHPARTPLAKSARSAAGLTGLLRRCTARTPQLRAQPKCGPP